MQVLRSFFVDDFSGGSKTTTAAFELYKKLNIRFLEGQFNLTKWRTNDKQLRLLISQIEGTKITVAKVLGILWDDENYEFIFNFKEVLEIANNFNITKRNEIMELSTDEEEIANIMVAGTEFEVEVQETLSVIEEVLTAEFRLLNIEDPDRLRSISARLQCSRRNAAIAGELRRQFEGK